MHVKHMIQQHFKHDLLLLIVAAAVVLLLLLLLLFMIYFNSNCYCFLFSRNAAMQYCLTDKMIKPWLAVGRTLAMENFGK